MDIRTVRSPLGVSRLLHPVAWWLWAGGLAVVANRTRNPLLLLILVSAVVLVAELRGEDRERRMTLFLWLAVIVVGIRLVAQVLFGGGAVGTTVVFRVPQIPLPDWTGAVRLGGPVTLEELASALYSGMSVAAMIVCLGAATVLAGPRRLLRYLPASLYELGTVIVVGLTYAPQLMDDARSARAARRLRGRSGRGVREVGKIVMPVLAGGLRRSMSLAASMESRGYGRPVRDRGRARHVAGLLTLVGAAGIAIGAYGLMSGGTSRTVTLVALVVGVAAAAAGLWSPPARRGDDDGPRRRTLHRPDPWTLPEWCLVLGAAAAVGLTFLAGAVDADALVPPTVPLDVPRLPWLAAAGVAAAVLTALMTPLPPARLVPPAPDRLVRPAPDRFPRRDQVTSHAPVAPERHLIASHDVARERSGDRRERFRPTVSPDRRGGGGGAAGARGGGGGGADARGGGGGAAGARGEGGGGADARGEGGGGAAARGGGGRAAGARGGGGGGAAARGGGGHGRGEPWAGGQRGGTGDSRGGPT